ncbi:MAG: ParA family protein [Vulcanimicrobiaceae bacterium]
MKVVAIVNQKGGVGKSTLALNLAPALAALEQRVLVVDLDPQGTATEGFLGSAAHPVGTAEILGYGAVNDVPLSIREARVRAPKHGCDLVAAHYARLRTQTSALRASPLDAQTAVMRTLAEVESDYDVVLIDCSPDLDVLTSAALVAAHEVLVPSDPSREAAHGLGYLFGRIDVARSLNPDLAVAGLVITRYNARVRFDAELRDVLAADPRFGYVQTIRFTTAFKRAFDIGSPLRTIARTEVEHAAVADMAAIATRLIGSGVPA